MAAWRLAADGVRALVLDRYAPPHATGSSHGITRLFRAACLEHPDLSAIALRSAELYRDLEKLRGVPVLDQCGGLTIGSASGNAIPGVIAAAERAGLTVELLDRAALQERFPFHTQLAPDDIGVLDPLSGSLQIENAVDTALDIAVSLGANVLQNVRVTDIVRIPGGYRITSSAGVFKAPKVVVALGSWTNDLFPEIPLKITRMPMTWFEPVEGHQGEPASIENSGVFIREIDDTGGYWGHGATDSGPAKVGPRGAVARGNEPGVDQLDRTFEVTDAAPAIAAVSRYLPSLSPVLSRGFICHSTRTPDEQFIVGEAPDNPGLFVATGESGHGGKHSAGIGQILADFVQEKEQAVEVTFMSPRRFQS